MSEIVILFSNDELLRRMLVTMHEMQAKSKVIFNTSIEILNWYLDIEMLLSLVVDSIVQVKL